MGKVLQWATLAGLNQRETTSLDANVQP